LSPTLSQSHPIRGCSAARSR